MSEPSLSDKTANAAPRESYNAPILKRLGEIGDLTQGLLGPGLDSLAIGSA